MTYHLLDHVNRLNAAELARCAAIGPECAAPLRTHGWTPPSDVVTCKQFDVDRNRHHVRYLGRGDLISCGLPIGPNHAAFTMPNLADVRKRRNVCRPFNEAHAHPLDFSTSLWPHVLCDDPRDAVRHTPPNHGHGSKCGCFFFAPNWDLSLVEPEIQGRRRMTAMVLSSGMRVIVRSASTGLVSPQDCPWCDWAGRVICDQDSMGGRREARVSPSHAAGGYAEWQRRNQFAGHGTFQVPPELSHIYATDGESSNTGRE